MSWALQLNEELQRYRQNLDALQKYDANLRHTVELIEKAQEEATKQVEQEIQALEEKRNLAKTEMENGSEILKLNGELALLQESFDATKPISAEKEKLEESYSDSESHYQALVGKKLRCERLIAENKRKFWKSSSSYKKERAAALNDMEKTKSEMEKIARELKARDKEFSSNKKEANRIQKQIREIQKQIKDFLNGKKEEISAYSSDCFDLRFGKRKLDGFLSEEEKKFIAQAFKLAASVNLQLAQDEYPELYQTLLLLIGYTSIDADVPDHESGTVWDDGNQSFLCKEKYEEIMDLQEADEDDEYLIFDKNATTSFDFSCNVLLSGNRLELREEYFEEREDTGEPSEDDDIVIELPDHVWTLDFPPKTFKNILKGREINLFYAKILGEKVLGYLQSEIAKDDQINFPTLVLNVWEKCTEQEIEVSKPMKKEVKELKRLFDLTPEQVLIAEQRYYKQKEIEQLEENARLDREQREEQARLDREEMEYQAERDRRQREREAERRERAEERRLNYERARDLENRRREDERREQEERDAEKRRKQEEREHWNQTMKEAKEERDMMHLCWKCANYCHGCRGGKVGCGNFIPK